MTRERMDLHHTVKLYCVAGESFQLPKGLCPLDRTALSPAPIRLLQTALASCSRPHNGRAVARRPLPLIPRS
jgi:hypothetical protein